MTKKQLKKVQYLIQKQFRVLIKDAIRLPLRSRLRLCYIVLFKKTKMIETTNNKD